MESKLKTALIIFLAILIISGFQIISAKSSVKSTAKTTVGLNLLVMSQLASSDTHCHITLRENFYNLSNGNALTISGKTINFFQDTLAAGTAKTNSKGEAPITIDALPGPHSAYATFTGDADFQPNGWSNTVTYECNLQTNKIVFKPKDIKIKQGEILNKSDDSPYKVPTPTGGDGGPWTYQIGSFMGGAPPLGVTMCPLKGTFTGKTISPPGKYCFDVIVTDIGGHFQTARMCIIVKIGYSDLIPYTPVGWSSPLDVSNVQKSLQSSNPKGIEIKNTKQIKKLVSIEKLSDFDSSDSPENDIEEEKTDSTTQAKSMTYTFTEQDSIYVSWAVLNNGTMPTEKGFVTSLIDSGNYIDFTYSTSLDPRYYIYVDNYALGKLPAGKYKLKLFADSFKEIKESKESNNKYSVSIIVTGGLGQCTGLNDDPNMCGPCNTDADCGPNGCWHGGLAPFC